MFYPISSWGWSRELRANPHFWLILWKAIMFTRHWFVHENQNFSGIIFRPCTQSRSVLTSFSPFFFPQKHANLRAFFHTPMVHDEKNLLTGTLKYNLGSKFRKVICHSERIWRKNCFTYMATLSFYPKLMKLLGIWYWKFPRCLMMFINHWTIPVFSPSMWFKTASSGFSDSIDFVSAPFIHGLPVKGVTISYNI